MNAHQYKVSARNSGIVTGICLLASGVAFIATGQSRVTAWLVLSLIIGALTCLYSSLLYWRMERRERNEISKKAATALEGVMTREQIAEGQKLAREFKPL